MGNFADIVDIADVNNVPYRDIRNILMATIFLRWQRSLHYYQMPINVGIQTYSDVL